MGYLDIIKTAFIYFPILAFIITLPYILQQYHKYGSIYWLKGLIVYSFILYLLIAYFLIILPLPSIEDVRNLTTPTMNLVPFSFVWEFINKSGLIISDFKTYIKAFSDATFYVPIFNIFLTFPFGIYLRYYFKFNLKKTVILTFLLSLFFEITQLSGLYFIYPRGYRLFDVDDLILNTLGGLIGYYIANFFIKNLPTRKEIDNKAFELGLKVTKLRRIVSFCLDFFIVIFLESIVFSFVNNKLFFYLLIFIYYVILPLKNGQTLANKFLNMKLVTNNEKKVNIYKVFIRNFLFILSYFLIFPILISIFTFLSNDLKISSIYIFMIFLFMPIYYLVSFISFLKNDYMFYEKISKTKYISTIKL